MKTKIKLQTFSDFFDYKVKTVEDDAVLLTELAIYNEFLKYPFEKRRFIPMLDGEVVVNPCDKSTRCFDFCQGSCQTEFYEALEDVWFKPLNQWHYQNMNNVRIKTLGAFINKFANDFPNDYQKGIFMRSNIINELRLWD